VELFYSSMGFFREVLIFTKRVVGRVLIAVVQLYRTDISPADCELGDIPVFQLFGCL
jgi:hypothetical protein